jgi:DNA-binding SARP family transcriptional activator
MNLVLAMRLKLLGCPAIFDGAGRKIDLRSKKSLALLAMLATSESGERSRVWLQQTLWSETNRLRAQASLRRELANLKAAVAGAEQWLQANYSSVKIDLDVVKVDIFEGALRSPNAEFLEGFDVEWTQNFTTWLDDVRGKLGS